jgi:two-component system, NarL family, nitrate/nitrite response regulator NarL
VSEHLRVAVVDDHPLFRTGVIRTLRELSDIEIVDQGGSAGDAVRIARELVPDIMLLDITIPGGGLEATREIREICTVNIPRQSRGL